MILRNSKSGYGSGNIRIRRKDKKKEMKRRHFFFSSLMVTFKGY